MKMKAAAALILFCALTVPARALEPMKSVANGCPNGIVVNLGKSLAGPGQKATSYIIERRTLGGAWQQLAEVSAPPDLSTFARRLEEAGRRLPPILSINDVPAQKLWDRLTAGRSVDSLKYWAGVLQVRLALGTSYFDATAQRGVSYEYRVSATSAGGAALPVLLSQPTSWPGRAKLAVLRVAKQSFDGKSISITWECGPGKRPVLFEVWRRTLDGTFQKIPSVVLTANRNNTTLAILRDTTVSPLMLYQYFLVPLDYYGNLGVASDTVLAGSYDFRTVPLPQNLSVQNDSGSGLRLSWRLQPGSPVKSLQIQRSLSFDKGFRQLATVAPSESTYLDCAVEPMVKYYYRLLLTGPQDETSAPSATIFGVWQNAEIPLRPTIVGFRGIQRGVELTLRTAESQTVGYRIYRGIGLGSPLSLITGLVPVEGEQTVFIDTSAGLSGALAYAYAVRAENAAGRLSELSDTVTVRPLIANVPPTPSPVTAAVTGRSVLLNWTDIQSQHPTLRGYRVCRAELKTTMSSPSSRRGKKAKTKAVPTTVIGTFVPIVDSLLPPFCNHCADTAVGDGNTFVYAVTAVDAFGDTSVMARTTRIALPEKATAPPAELRVERIPGGVRLFWDEVIGPSVSGFRIYRAEAKGKPSLLAEVGTDSLSYTDVTVQKNRLFFYWISTVMDGKESNRSGEVGIRP